MREREQSFKWRHIAERPHPRSLPTITHTGDSNTKTNSSFTYWNPITRPTTSYNAPDKQQRVVSRIGTVQQQNSAAHGTPAAMLHPSCVIVLFAAVVGYRCAAKYSNYNLYFYTFLSF